MAHSHAHAALDFDLQTHNLLIRLYSWHIFGMPIKRFESTVETESYTDCWGWPFFSSSLFSLLLSPTDREDQSILCTWVYRLSLLLHHEFICMNFILILSFQIFCASLKLLLLHHIKVNVAKKIVLGTQNPQMLLDLVMLTYCMFTSHTALYFSVAFILFMFE